MSLSEIRIECQCLLKNFGSLGILIVLVQFLALFQ
jgi:hypothetical protein